MFMSFAKASARFGKTPGIPPGTKLTLPKLPTSVLPFHHLTATQRRQASVRYTPTRYHPAIPGVMDKSITPGHVEWLFNPDEIRRFEPLKSRLPADFWNQLLQAKNQQDPPVVTAGHSPDSEKPLIYRAWRVDGSFGAQYLNLEVKAAPWFTPHGTDDTTRQIDLGDFDDDTLVLLFDILRQQPGWHYSAKGKEGTPPQNLWNADDWNYYLKNHVLPLGSPHCINFLVHCLEPVAERLAPGSSVLLHLKQDLGYARQPEDVAAVLRAYFRFDEKRRPSLVSLPPTVKWPATHIPPKPADQPSKPPQTKTEQVPSHPAHHGSDDDDDDEEVIYTDGGAIWVPKDKVKPVEEAIKAEQTHATATPNYKQAEQAFAGDPAVFERMASQLIADGTVFAASFAKKEFLEWNNQTFRHIGEEMKRRPGKPVGVVLFHRNMYGDVTHISNFFVSAAGRVVIGHHESIDVGKAGMVDGLATGTVGCVSPTFYTLMLHNAVRKIFGLPPITEDQLPAMKSLAQTGTPTAHVIPIENFEAVEAFILRSASQSLTKLGLTVPYGVDPNPTLAKAAKDAAAGKLLTPLQAKLLNAEKHFAIHPKAHPPGGSGPFAPGEASNNCARFELLCLQAAEAPGVAGMTYSAEMDLADVTECLFKAGALPNTDPEIIHLMRKGGYYKDPKTGLVTRHPLSFLALAYGWSLAPPNTPGVYPAHVNRVKMPEQDKLDAKLKDAWAKVLTTVQKNVDSFSTDTPAVHSALDIKKPPSPVQPVVTEADWHDVTAHVNTLTKEEREWRFGVAETDEVIKSLRTAPPNDQHFYVLRDAKTHAITLLLQIRLSTDHHDLIVEVGTSVPADHRRKGLGLWGIAWAIAWGQNRGATYFRGHYDIKIGPKVKNQLMKLKRPVNFSKSIYGSTHEEFSIPLTPADHDTHWLEGFAQELQFDRNPPPKK